MTHRFLLAIEDTDFESGLSMGYRKNSAETFTGGSGQLAVMSELLQRQCNAAIPLVDIGTDVFAFRDDREEVARIQVKTATATPYKKRAGFSADFRIPIDQLKRIDSPPLFYALAARLGQRWAGFIVISREGLQQLRENGCGTETKNKSLKLFINFYQEGENNNQLQAFCGEINLTRFLNSWENLPPLKAPVAIDFDIIPEKMNQPL